MLMLLFFILIYIATFLYVYVYEREKKLFLIISTSILFKFVVFSAIIIWQNMIRGFPDVSGDAYLYWMKANVMANTNIIYLDNVPSTMILSEYGFNFLTLLEAFFVKGYAPNSVTIKFIHIFFYIISAILIFKIAYIIFNNKRKAYISTALFSFWPSYLVLFSVNYRDNVVITTLLIFVFLSQKIFGKTKVRFKILYLLCILLIFIIQKYTQPVIIIAELIGLLLYIFLFILDKYAKIIIINILLVFLLKNYDAIKSKLIDGLYEVAVRAETQSIIEGASFFQYRFNDIEKKVKTHWCFPYHFDYKVYKNCNDIKFVKDYMYITKKILLKQSQLHCDINIFNWVISLFIGLYYSLLSPLVWNITTVNQLVFAPEMVMWYIVLFFFIMALLLYRKKNIKSIFIPMIILIIEYIILAFSEGNIGAVFRHRSWVNWIIIMIASESIYYIWCIVKSYKK